MLAYLRQQQYRHELKTLIEQRSCYWYSLIKNDYAEPLLLTAIAGAVAGDILNRTMCRTAEVVAIGDKSRSAKEGRRLPMAANAIHGCICKGLGAAKGDDDKKVLFAFMHHSITGGSCLDTLTTYDARTLLAKLDGVIPCMMLLKTGHVDREVFDFVLDQLAKFDLLGVDLLVHTAKNIAENLAQADAG